jgi:hypothetical protein
MIEYDSKWIDIAMYYGDYERAREHALAFESIYGCKYYRWYEILRCLAEQDEREAGL